MNSEELYQQISTNKFIIAGPCVAENMELLEASAELLVGLKAKHNIPFIFKASFDKANRTSASSYRGPGIEKGLQMLAAIKDKYKLPILTDIHEAWQAKEVAGIIDIIQIPAFLCRQTDLLVASANTGAIINIKKAQFLSGADMLYPVEKVRAAGNSKILLTERGNMYGYNNLVVDFRNIMDMQNYGVPVVMDATHSVQKPGGAGGKSGGNREYVPLLAKAAKGAGVDGYFFEIHTNPDAALSDGPNMLNFADFANLIPELLA
ncbi:MAG: 3-deoxy-8-phosphooctulonate synthase [Bacteroidetes bacterium]|nr:3-deoxy-8-phosphooctulonate synthase [Bacteroidota bacterium]